jgi:hypothetical protein
MYGFKTEIMKVTGNITECMEKVKLPGLMEDVMKASINMIRNMALVHFIGRMVENMLVIGKMENNMVEANIIYQVDKRKLENGSKVKKLNGSNKMPAIKLHDYTIDKKLNFFNV